MLNHREESLKHPRGEYEYDKTPAVVSDHPCAPAASSHSAWLPTHAPPLLSVHNPDVRASNPFAALAPRTPEAAAHAASQTAALVAALHILAKKKKKSYYYKQTRRALLARLKSQCTRIY